MNEVGLAIKDDGNSFRVLFFSSHSFCMSVPLSFCISFILCGRGYGHQHLWGHILVAPGKKRKKGPQEQLWLNWLKWHANFCPFTVVRCMGYAEFLIPTVGKNSSSREQELYHYWKKEGRGLGRQKQWESWLIHVDDDEDAFMYGGLYNVKKHFHIHHVCWSPQKPYEIWLLSPFYRWGNRLRVLQLAHAIVVIKHLTKI